MLFRTVVIVRHFLPPTTSSPPPSPQPPLIVPPTDRRHSPPRPLHPLLRFLRSLHLPLRRSLEHLRFRVVLVHGNEPGRDDLHAMAVLWIYSGQGRVDGAFSSVVFL